MLDNITLANIFVAIIITGAILFIFLLYVAFRLESLSLKFERQHYISELKNQIVAELKKDNSK